jgi:hypothetical protein
MPITQTPTANIIDKNARHFMISFGVTIVDGENSQEITVPNQTANVGSVYNIDLSGVNTPARGNLPGIRSLGFSMNAFPAAGPASFTNTIYVWNPRTKQLYSFLPPLTQATVAAYSGQINGVVPFFCETTQSIFITRADGGATQVSCSFFAFTFDVSPFYSINDPSPFITD